MERGNGREQSIRITSFFHIDLATAREYTHLHSLTHPRLNFKLTHTAHTQTHTYTPEIKCLGLKVTL